LVVTICIHTKNNYLRKRINQQQTINSPVLVVTATHVNAIGRKGPLISVLSVSIPFSWRDALFSVEEVLPAVTTECRWQPVAAGKSAILSVDPTA